MGSRCGRVFFWRAVMVLLLLALSGGRGASLADPIPRKEEQTWELGANGPDLSGNNMDILGPVALGGSTSAVAVQGSLAYVGVGSRLAVVDVANPVAPRMVGQSDPLPSLVEEIVVDGDWAYVAAGGAGLYVVDVAAPTTPRIVGACATPGDAQDVAASGSIAYVADNSEAGLRVVNVSNPAAPHEVGRCDTGKGALSVVVEGSLAYVTSWTDLEVGILTASLVVIDVSNPTAPHIVGSHDMGAQWLDGLEVVGSMAYVVSYGLTIFDVSSPIAPHQVGYCRAGGYAGDVAVAGSYAYVTGDGLRVVDVADPAAPREVATLEGHPSAISLAGSLAYITDGGALRVVDVSDPTAPHQVGILRIATLPARVWLPLLVRPASVAAGGERARFDSDVTSGCTMILHRSLGRGSAMDIAATVPVGAASIPRPRRTP